VAGEPQIDGREVFRQREIEIAAKAERYGEVHANNPPRVGLTEAIRRALLRIRRAKDSDS
jgi:hypothetical protein